MATDPTGIVWGPMIRLRQALSEAVAFQSWVGASNNTTALDYIHLFEDRGNLDQTRFAVIMESDNYSLTRDSTGAGIQAFRPILSARLGLLEKVASHNQENATAFLKSVALVLDGILQHDNAALYNSIERWAPEAAGIRWKNGQEYGYQWYWNFTEDRQ